MTRGGIATAVPPLPFCSQPPQRFFVIFVFAFPSAPAAFVFVEAVLVDFFAAAFAFGAAFFAAGFFAGDFFAAVVFAEAFFAVALVVDFAAAFLAGAFLDVDFDFVVSVFFVAMRRSVRRGVLR